MPYKFSISFGLVYIPVVLNNCIKKKDIGFHMLDKRTGERIRYKKTAGEGEEVLSENIIKGYEYEKGRYVTFEQEEFDALKKQKDKNIVIEKFVSLDEIDPVYFEKPYYIQPSGADKAYALFKQALKQSNKAGIAHAVFGEKETLMILRVANDRLIANTMHFYDEIAIIADNVNADVNDKELKLALTIIESMSGAFEPKEYKNEYRLRIEDAISKKIEGKEIVVEQKSEHTKIVDLMEALQMSLNMANNANTSQPYTSQ